MAVFMMVDKDEPGAVHVPSWDQALQDGTIHKIYIKETFKGCVVNTSERNGYHDSDFYCTVWDESAGSFRTFEYASTRGWCYPNNAVIDASPELMEKYKQWQMRQEDIARQARYNILAQPFIDAGVNPSFIPELVSFRGPDRDVLLSLLKTKTFKSEFRKSLRLQLETWLATPKGQRKFHSPFSARQWESLLRFAPRRYCYR